MKREIKRSNASVNYAQRNCAQSTRHKETYNSQRKQYQNVSQNYYMYTANAVARDYRYEDEMTHSPQKKKKKAKRPVLAQHISTLFVVFLLGMALVVQYTYIQNLGYQISQSKNELKTVQDENEKIKKQIAAMGELQNVENIAVNNMGMHKPNEWEIIYLPQIEQPEKQSGDEGSLDQAANQVKDIIGTIMP